MLEFCTLFVSETLFAYHHNFEYIHGWGGGLNLVIHESGLGGQGDISILFYSSVARVTAYCIVGNFDVKN